MVVCFTGHRPNKLHGYDIYSEGNKEIGKAMRALMVRMVENCIKKSEKVTFVCGGALGIDTIACEISLDLRREYPNVVSVELAIPCSTQGSNWRNRVDIDRYEKHIKSVDVVTYVDELEGYGIRGVSSGEYHIAKMQKRNEYMINKSDYVIGVWNGDISGGTYNAIKYARKVGKDIFYINVNTLKITKNEY